MRSCATDLGQGDPKVLPRDFKALAEDADTGVHATLSGCAGQRRWDMIGAHLSPKRDKPIARLL